MSADSLAMMPWFPRDFIAATRAMRIAERCAYRELLDFQWELGVLPDDETRLARLIGFTPDEFADAWPAIRSKFAQVDGGIANQRLEQHREKALQQRDKKRKGAEIANAKRDAQRSAQRDGERIAERDAQRSAKHPASATPPSPSPSPSVEEKKDSSLRSESKESRRARAPTATHLPEDFKLTDEMRRIAGDERLDPDRTFMLFCNYWRAKSGANARKRDWIATWRVWCMSDKHGPNGNSHSQQPRPTRFEQLFGKEETYVADDDEPSAKAMA